MLFYLQCAFYLVILPLPDPVKVAAKTGPYYNLVPFQNVYDFLEKSSFDMSQPSTWLRAMRENYFLEPVFNFLLLTPFGIYLAYYFKSSLRKVILFSFAVSLFFELTQLTGLWGVYSRPYRLFDINDLMLNTLGGILGFVIFKCFRKVLPSRERIDEVSVERGRKVGFIRRGVALFVDSIIVGLISVVIAKFTDFKAVYVVIVTLSIYFPLIAVIFRGGTLGKLLVLIKIAGFGKKAPPLLPMVLIRYILRDSLISLSMWLTVLISTANIAYRFIAVVGELLIVIFSCADFVISVKKGKRLWYERLTKTQNSAIRTK
jgi:glycopeptide antibiotics resistance protein